jgi:membrane-associated phospholipid phosphatase
MPGARTAGAVGRFLGTFYPLILVTFLYRETGLVNEPAGRHHDAQVQLWELALFGFQPSVAWIRAWPWPWLSWTMHLGYIGYYLIVAGAPLAVWMRGIKGGVERLLLALMGTFYICYVAFLVFPVRGPRHLFEPAVNAAIAVPPAVLAHAILHAGAAWGAAFPSSHVAAVWTMGLVAARVWRGLGYVLLPMAALVTLGTVYGQFHYAVDALAGILVAVVVAALDRRMAR